MLASYSGLTNLEVPLNRTIALAYGITGLAVAAALVAIIGTTTGLLGSTPTTPTEMQLASGAPPAELAAPPTASPAAQAAAPGAAATSVAPGAAAAAPEIVYVDAPPVAGAGRGEDDDRDDHEGREHQARGAGRHAEEHDDD